MSRFQDNQRKLTYATMQHQFGMFQWDSLRKNLFHSFRVVLGGFIPFISPLARGSGSVQTWQLLQGFLSATVNLSMIFHADHFHFFSLVCQSSYKRVPKKTKKEYCKKAKSKQIVGSKQNWKSRVQYPDLSGTEKFQKYS